MANNTFEFIGKIIAPKEKRFFEDTENGTSGWVSRVFHCMMVCGEDVQFLDLRTGKFSETSGKSTTIYTFDTDKNKFNVEWADRFNADIVSQVASYKKCYINLSTSETDVVKESFISEYDFVERLDEIFSDPDMNNQIFRISGNINFSYSFKNERHYRSFTPTSVKLMPADTVPSCKAKFETFFHGKSALTAPNTKDNTIGLNGYLKYYDSMAKKNLFAPSCVVFNTEEESEKALIDMIKTSYGTKNTVQMVSLSVDLINRSPVVELTDDEIIKGLTTEQKKLVSSGIIPLERMVAKIKSEQSTAIGKEKVTQSKYIELGNSKGISECEYQLSDLVEKPDPNGNSTTPSKSTATTKTAVSKPTTSTATSTATESTPKKKTEPAKTTEAKPVETKPVKTEEKKQEEEVDIFASDGIDVPFEI